MVRCTEHLTHGPNYTAALAKEAKKMLILGADELKALEATDDESLKKAEKVASAKYLARVATKIFYLGEFEIAALQRVLAKTASANDDIYDGETVYIVVWTLEELIVMGKTGDCPQQFQVDEAGRWLHRPSCKRSINDCNVLQTMKGKHFNYLRPNNLMDETVNK